MPDHTNSLLAAPTDESMTEGAFPSLSVPALPFRETWGWEALEAALAEAPALFLRQAWLPSPQEAFRPGIVRLGWQESTIIVAVSLDDDRIFTQATADHQRLWELGDVFEIFLRDAERDDYFELHIAPSDKRLQLHFPSRQTVADLRSGRGRLNDFIRRESLFDFRIRTSTGKWDILAWIPASSLGLKVSSLTGRSLFASFSRYDYSSDGGPAVLSSTSAHPTPDFHRQEEWIGLIFR
jgi:hypothetical protein